MQDTPRQAELLRHQSQRSIFRGQSQQTEYYPVEEVPAVRCTDTGQNVAMTVRVPVIQGTCTAASFLD
jgi:hypothetical protein